MDSGDTILYIGSESDFESILLNCKDIKRDQFIFVPPVYLKIVEALSRLNPNLVVIELHGFDDEMAHKLVAEFRYVFFVPFIIITIFNSKILNLSKEHQASTVLLKPFSLTQLYVSIEIALSQVSKERDQVLLQFHQDYLFIRTLNSFRKIKFDEILYLKSEHVYVEIHTRKEKPMLFRSSLIELKKKLPDYFIQVHRSYIANQNYVNFINSVYLLLNDIRIPVSRSYKKELKSRMVNKTS